MKPESSGCLVKGIFGVFGFALLAEMTTRWDEAGMFAALAIIIICFVVWTRTSAGRQWIKEQRIYREEQRVLKEEQNKVASKERTIKVGFNTVRRRLEGHYYISDVPMKEPDELFTFEGLEHKGSRFETRSKTTGRTTQQGRAGSALVGGLLFGPVGAIIGASGKRKGKVISRITHKEREIKGRIDVYFRSIDTLEVKSIWGNVSNSEAANIERFFY